MQSDLTDITLVIDRSGSMERSKEEAENGVNHFVEEQKNQPGKALLSLVQFDTEYEFVHRGVPVQDVPKYTLVPRGWTAMLDAVGRAISETGDRLSKMTEEERPGLVVFVIVTDGMENSSHEFTRAQVKGMIEHQEKTYNWRFTFLGANQDAFAEAASIGIAANAAANYAVGKEAKTFGSAAANVARMRSATAKGMIASASYTDEERKAMS